MSDYREALQTYLQANANPTHKYGHQPRLYALAQQIGTGLTYDDDVVFAAVFLHDLGVFDIRNTRHIQSVYHAGKLIPNPAPAN